jgi:NDP-sugar pyrophosphorylase family protein
MSQDIQLVIPMTGVGQRFVDRGYTDIKPLIQTGMGSMLNGVLRNFQSITSPICIISESHPQKSKLRDEIIALRPRARIIEINAHKKGPSFAIWCAKEHLDLGLPTIVNYCDFSGIWSETELIENLTKQDGLILTYQGFHPHRLRSNEYAYVKKDENGLVVDVQEKKSFTDNPLKEEASSGTYGFKSAEVMISAIQKQLDSDISHSGEFYTSLTYIPMISEGLEVRTLLIEKFFQWGTPDDLEDFVFWCELAKKKTSHKYQPQLANGLILAAGFGTRLAEFTKTPKPIIKVFGKSLWEYAGEFIDSCSDKFIFVRGLDEALYDLGNYPNITKLTIDYVTKSQAESAKIGLEMIKLKDLPVHILAADNIFQNLNANVLTEDLIVNDLVVWVTKNYSLAKHAPGQFTWVDVDEKNQVTNVHFKDNYPNKNSLTILGNFSFKSTRIAERVIEEVISKSPVNSETYLDHVIEYCLENNYKVSAFDVNKSFSIGTKDEWLTFSYWQESFGVSGQFI